MHSCTGAALGKRYIEVYPVAAAAVGRSWLGGVNPPSGGGRFGRGLPPGGGGRPTQIAIFAFSATRQTAMPIRIVPRFCARGCGRFEKLLYGCRNPSRWDKTDVVAKISMLRLNIGSGMLRLSSCMLRLGLRLSIGSCMLRLGLRLRLSFRGSGGKPLPLKLSLSPPCMIQC